ncbi:MAG: STAS/SEC14 domain-containing protein [Pseudorhodobacter sp.]
MATSYRMIHETKTFEFTVSGKVTSEDFDALAAPLEDFVDEHGKIRLLEIIEDFQGFDPSVLWKGLKFDIKIIPHISQCAVVSDMGWISPITKAAGAFMSTKLRTFDLSELDAARAWLAEA